MRIFATFCRLTPVIICRSKHAQAKRLQFLQQRVPEMYCLTKSQTVRKLGDVPDDTIKGFIAVRRIKTRVSSTADPLDHVHHEMMLGRQLAARAAIKINMPHVMEEQFTLALPIHLTVATPDDILDLLRGFA